MWTYRQSTGELALNGKIVAAGYAGKGIGKNNPAMQDVRDCGPIPQGTYTIGGAIDTADHGPFAMPLYPNSANEMFGREGFWMHGDSIVHPGDASEGCIIMPLAARVNVRESGDPRLQVIE